MKKFIFSLIFFFLFIPHAQAVGLTLSPAKIEVVYPRIKSAELIITNISSEPILVKISPDNWIKEIIIHDAEFALMPEAKTKVKIDFNFSVHKSQIYQTNLSVVANALSAASFKAASGIKVPLSVSVTPTKTKLVLFIFFPILLLFLVIISIFYYYQRKKSLLHRLHLDFLRLHKKHRH
ncbi:MAG: hypothetical protein UR94_C0027G0003 [Parcubacteria group bacterium GW2011_GWA2_36_10]|nr:MAG: hypothetical protein UR94_C0027G0003 [Parcubacteria group bacterium GW2011_GWA2_36_10]